MVGPHRPGRSGVASLPVSPCCLMSLRAKVDIKTPLPLTGWGQGCRATDMWPLSLAHSAPSAASSRPPHPCHACGSPPFPRLHDRRPCPSWAPVLRLACAGSRTQASVQCQNAAFPVREPWPPCLLQRAFTSRTLQGTVLLPRGTSCVPLAGWSPSWVSASAPPLALPPLLVSVTASVSWSRAPPRAPRGKGLRALVLPESLLCPPYSVPVTC